MTAENSVSKIETGLERVVIGLGSPSCIARLEAFTTLAQRDPESAALMIGRKDIIHKASCADSGD